MEKIAEEERLARSKAAHQGLNLQLQLKQLQEEEAKVETLIAGYLESMANHRIIYM